MRRARATSSRGTRHARRSESRDQPFDWNWDWGDWGDWGGGSRRDDDFEEEEWEDLRDLPPQEAAERAYAEARSVAARKARVARDLLIFLCVVGFIALFSRTAAFFVGIFWGFGLARDAIRTWVEPELRERWVDREVARRMHHHARHHRREVADSHSRDIEELAAGVAQEIRDPISSAKQLVQRMGEDPAARTNVDTASAALSELGRVEQSIAHLLRFAREPGFRFEEVAIEEVVEAATNVLRERIEREGVALRIELDAPGVLWADREKLGRVVLNLLANAIDAVAVVTRPEIELSGGSDLAGREVWIRVKDNGPGIPQERVERIFSPFSSTNETNAGPGLAVVRKLVEGHGGRIELTGRGPVGSEFLVTLPRTAVPPEPEAGRGPRPPY